MGFDLPLLNRRRRAGGFNPAVLFSAGEQGTIFDTNLLATLFQDTTGTTPVTAVAQTVGLILDNSKGLVLGSELVTNGDFSSGATGWNVSAQSSITGGAGRIVSADGTFQNISQSKLLTGGRFYRLSFSVVARAAGAVQFAFTGGGVSLGPVASTTGTFSYIFYVTTTASSSLDFFRSGVTDITIDNISVKELLGYHAIQGTLLSRPTYRNPSGVPYLEDDGGDSMNWTAPAGTYTIARVNSAGTVTILTAQALSGATDMLLDAQTTAYVAVNRALTASETEMLTAWLRSRAGL